MNVSKSAKVLFAVLAAAVVSCGVAASKKGGDFVLIDGQRTRLPVMSCKLPGGCAALGKVVWNNKPADPVRFHIQAVGVADGALSTVSGGFLVQQRNILAGPAQCPEVRVPAQLAQWAAGEICGVYGLGNVKVLKADAVPLQNDRAAAYANSVVVGARRAGLVFSETWVKAMHFRYAGTRNGKPVVVNAVFPYFFFVNGGRFANGAALELSTTCSAPKDEPLAMIRSNRQLDQEQQPDGAGDDAHQPRPGGRVRAQPRGDVVQQRDAERRGRPVLRRDPRRRAGEESGDRTRDVRLHGVRPLRGQLRRRPALLERQRRYGELRPEQQRGVQRRQLARSEIVHFSGMAVRSGSRHL